jgi:hypothetical protein
MRPVRYQHGETAERIRVTNGTEPLAEHPEWCHIALPSNGNPVLVSNAAGWVAFLNPVAESWTGWLQADATGQPLRSVFRIVNEPTPRNPAGVHHFTLQRSLPAVGRPSAWEAGRPICPTCVGLPPGSWHRFSAGQAASGQGGWLR